MKLTKLFFGVVDALLATLWALSVPAQSLDGKTLYQKKMCFACHGQEGKGGPAGPLLKNLGKSKEELITFLKKGSPKMRPFKGSSEELNAIVDYIVSLK